MARAAVLRDVGRSLVSARSRMRKEDYREDGKGERTISAGHTTLITIRGKRLGFDQQPTSMPVRTVRRWSSKRPLSDRGIKLVCFPRTGLAPTPLRFLIARARPRNHLHQRRVRLRVAVLPTLRKWSPLVRLPPELVSYRLAGNNGTHLKDARTSWTTILVLPHGWILDGSSTSGCTAKTLAPATLPFNSSQCLNLDLCRVAGKCV